MARAGRNMRVVKQTIAAVLAANLLLGCAALLPTLRDDYMGKAILQPHKVPKPVTHDDNGIADTETPGWSFSRLLPWVFNTN